MSPKPWLTRYLIATCLVLLLAHPAAARDQVWVAFGDSITWDTSHTPEEGSWLDMVAAATGNKVINAGYPGNSTEQALYRVEQDVLPLKPDLVLVMFGINDQMIPQGSSPMAFRVPPRQYAFNLEQIVAKLLKSGAQVVLMTNRPLVEGPTKGGRLFLNRHGNGGALYTLPGKTKASIHYYNDIVRKIASLQKIPLVDIWAKVVEQGGGNDSDQSVLKAGIDRSGADLDGVHLGPGGHRLIAEAIIAATPFPAAAAQNTVKPVTPPLTKTE